MGEETMIVGSAEHKAWQGQRIAERFNQAIEEISDQGVFTDDQIAALNNAIILMRWGVSEALATPPADTPIEGE